jgi:hypothetical protein
MPFRRPQEAGGGYLGLSWRKLDEDGERSHNKKLHNS